MGPKRHSLLTHVLELYSTILETIENQPSGPFHWHRMWSWSIFFSTVTTTVWVGVEVDRCTGFKRDGLYSISGGINVSSEYSTVIQIVTKGIFDWLDTRSK